MEILKWIGIMFAMAFIGSTLQKLLHPDYVRDYDPRQRAEQIIQQENESEIISMCTQKSMSNSEVCQKINE